MKSSAATVIVFLTLFAFACDNNDVNALTDCEKSTLAIQVERITPASSCSTPDGTIEIGVTGGEPPYSYYVNEVPKEGPLFVGLSSGIFAIRVKDASGCERSVDNITVMATGFSFEAIVVENTECIGGNGSVVIEVSEGTPPYAYKFGDGAFAASNTIEELAHGNYSVLLKDGNGCTVALNIVVPKGVTGTSWQHDIKPLITTYCALSGCHNGQSRPDLRLYDKAKQYASQIKTLTQNRSMPFEGTLTQDQIDIIACWVDEGALNN